MKPERTSGLENSATSEHAIAAGNERDIPGGNVHGRQQQAAKDFLNWLVNDEAGNAFLTEDCQLVPAYSNIPADNLDPLGASVKSYADAGNLIPNYNFLPDDHYSVLGASMQKYLAGEIDRKGLADEIVSYWKTAQVIAH